MISADQTLPILACLLALVACGLWIEARPRIGQFGVLFIILGGLVLGTSGILPRQAPLYATITQLVVPFSIPLLLFQANIRTIWRQSGRVLLAFLLAAIITVGAAVAAMQIVDLGPDEVLWSSIATAGFIGGSANTAAVADALGKLNDPEFSVLVASVYMVAIPFFAFLVAMPAIPIVWRLFSPHRTIESGPPSNAEVEKKLPITARSLGGALALSAAIVGFAEVTVGTSATQEMKYLVITGLSVLVATFLPEQARKLEGHYEAGQILIYIFFAIVGVQIQIGAALSQGGALMAFTVILLATHLTLLSLAGRLFRLSGEELLIACNACILGPAPAAAMAVAQGWRSLVTPGLLCGLLGYAIANFVGIFMAKLLS